MERNRIENLHAELRKSCRLNRMLQMKCYQGSGDLRLLLMISVYVRKKAHQKCMNFSTSRMKTVAPPMQISAFMGGMVPAAPMGIAPEGMLFTRFLL